MIGRRFPIELAVKTLTITKNNAEILSYVLKSVCAALNSSKDAHLGQNLAFGLSKNLHELRRTEHDVRSGRN